MIILKMDEAVNWSWAITLYLLWILLLLFPFFFGSQTIFKKNKPLLFKLSGGDITATTDTISIILGVLSYLSQCASFILIPILLDTNIISWYQVFIPHWISLGLILLSSIYKRAKKSTSQNRFTGMETVIVSALVIGLELIIAAKLQGSIMNSCTLFIFKKI